MIHGNDKEFVAWFDALKGTFPEEEVEEAIEHMDDYYVRYCIEKRHAKIVKILEEKKNDD